MLFITMIQEADSVSLSKLDLLLMRLATGEKDALAELYGGTRAAVYGFALSILKHPADAEDVLQDTYVRLYAAAANYQTRNSPMGYILTIAKNLSLMKLRERGRYEDLEPHEWECALQGTDPGEQRQLLLAALNILSSEERQVVLLHATSGLKHREIAKLLNLALPTVLSKYHRALKKLRIYLEGADAS